MKSTVPVAFLFCLVASAACSICCVHFRAYNSANPFFFLVFFSPSPLLFSNPIDSQR